MIGIPRCRRLSLLHDALRFVIYATISNPWHGMPAEALRGMTFAGFWAASTCHVGVIAPPGLSTTMVRRLGGVS